MRTTGCVLVLGLVVGLLGCGPEPDSFLQKKSPPAASATSAPASPTASAAKGPTMNEGPMDASFDALSSRFLNEYLKRNPMRATEAGDHSYDALWPDVSPAGDAADRAWIQALLTELGSIPADKLSVQRRVDRGIVENKLRYFLFMLDEVKENDWNPMSYTGLVGDGLDPLISREFAPLEERMTSLEGRLRGIPTILAAAKKRLAHSPKVFAETAIAQNRGLIDLCEHGLADSIAKVPAKKAALEDAAKIAAAALKDFQTFLEKDLLPKADGDFRLGRAKFEKKLRYELDDEVDIDGVADGAKALLTTTLDEMVQTSKELWPTLMGKDALPPSATADDKKALVKKVLDEVAKDHPDNATIVKEATDWLAQATQFTRDKDLVRVPDEPCKVIEMPEYRRGVAVAYCDASGPLEKKPETFYTISPTPKDWSQKRADSFYREYNRSMLAELTIHEAMPGHFLQLMHNNQFPSKLRAVFSSGSFVEGWAVYTEWLMAKYGFGGPKVRLMRQKMVLRLCANAILDHDIHAGKMDEKGALDLMMKEAFQEEGEAVGKWKRARLSSAQLTTYYYGFTEMMKLRAQHEKDPGFTERSYHDRVIGSGSPPMRALRGLLAGKPSER